MSNVIQFQKVVDVNGDRCNHCRKTITEMWDVEQDFNLEHECLPYTDVSKYDGYKFRLKLCNKCMDEFIEHMVDWCEINPLTDNGLL